MIKYQAARQAGLPTWPFKAKGRFHEATKTPNYEYLIV